MGNTYWVARQTPFSQEHMRKVVMGDGLSNTGTVLLAQDAADNVGLFTALFGASAARVLALGGPATPPTTSPADVVQLWVADTNAVAGKAGLHIRTEDGTSHVFGDTLGFGTVTPTGFLHAVMGNSTARFERETGNAANGATVVTFQTRANSDTISNGYGPYIVWSIKNLTGTEFNLARAMALRDGADNTGRFSIDVASAGTFTERVRIDASGNIGFSQTTFGTSAAKILALGSGTAPTTSPADAVQLWSADRGGAAGKGSLFLRTEDGTSHVFGDRVGIGTLTPTANLHYYHATAPSFGVDGPAGSTRQLNFYTAGSLRWILQVQSTAESGSNVGSDLAILARDDSGAGITAPLFCQRATGNIGLWTSSALFGTSAARVLAMSGVNSVAPSTSPADAVQLWVADRGATAGKASLHLRTEDATSHVFGDLVGIGTVSPRGSLELVGTGGELLYVSRYAASVNGSNLKLFKARGTEASPGLSLAGDQVGYLEAQGYVRNAGDTANGFQGLGRIAITIESVDAQSRAASSMTFLLVTSASAALSEKMRLTAAGNLGIATTTPLFPLHVAGRLAYGVPTTAPTDADLSNSQVSAWYDEATSTLTFRIKDSTGTLKTATLIAA